MTSSIFISRIRCGGGGGGDRQTDRQKRRDTEYRHTDLLVIRSAREECKAMERGPDMGRVRLMMMTMS